MRTGSAKGFGGGPATPRTRTTAPVRRRYRRPAPVRRAPRRRFRGLGDPGSLRECRELPRVVPGVLRPPCRLPLALPGCPRAWSEPRVARPRSAWRGESGLGRCWGMGELSKQQMVEILEDLALNGGDSAKAQGDRDAFRHREGRAGDT